jgi:hypothetical protein
MKHHDLHTLHERNEGKEFFKYLVKIANADGIIDNAEKKVLHRAGRKFGLTDPEIDKLTESPVESVYQPPYELEKRFHKLYSIIVLITADENIHEDELKFARYFAIASGFDPVQSEKIISFIIKGIKDNIDEDDLFKKYRKEAV